MSLPLGGLIAFCVAYINSARWVRWYKLGGTPKNGGRAGMVIYQHPGIWDTVSIILSIVALIATVVIPFRLFICWRRAGGFHERRDKRRAFWFTLMFIPWLWGLGGHWLALEGFIMAGKLQGQAVVTEGIVGHYGCGARAATKLGLAEGREQYLMRHCPGADAVRMGDRVRVSWVIGVYGDREVIQLEKLSGALPQ